MENRIPRIYFSKSRAGNFDDILKVKNYLSQYDCEIIEFTGGIYTPEKLDSADLLLILPPELDRFEFVGRGQFEEFGRALNDVGKWELPFLITDITAEGIPFGVLIDDGDIIDKNWTTDYGRFLSIDTDEEISIDDAFNLNIKRYSKNKGKGSKEFFPDLEDPKEQNVWIKTIGSLLSELSQERVDKVTGEIIPASLPAVTHQLTYEEVFNSLNLL